MIRKPLLGIFLLSLCTFIFISCSDDDDVRDPSGTITLNMLNEDNGKTFLGTSGTYINNSNNFKTTSNFIIDAGSRAGVGVKIEPQINNLAQEVAVSTGHLYQIFDKATLREFASGKQAIQIEAGYYNVYVVSPIVNNSVTAGAVIKYVLVYPETKGLPENGKIIGNLNYAGEKVEFTLPQDAECYFEEHWGSGEKGAFDVKTVDGKLTIDLLKSSDKTYGPYGTYNIYIRKGNVFTTVRLNIGL